MIAGNNRLPLAKMLTIGLLPSCLKIWWYRRKGAKIRAGVRIGLGSVVSAEGSIDIGANTAVGMFTTISCGGLQVGKRTKIRSLVHMDAEQIVIGNDVTISEMAIIRALVPSRRSRVVVRDRAHIFPFSMIDPTREVTIGEESSVGYDTYIFTHGAYKSVLDGYPVEFGEVHIGDRVWIPCRVLIMPSVTIGDDAVIGAGAIVSQDIPAGALAVGTPARVIKDRDQYVVHRSDEEKLAILSGILTEFCEHLEDYAHAKCHRQEGGDRSTWKLALHGGRKVWELELLVSPTSAAQHRLSIFLEEVSSETMMAWNREKKEWFSIGSHQCSEHLGEMGEELRDFLRRYGLYFARP